MVTKTIQPKQPKAPGGPIIAKSPGAAKKGIKTSVKKGSKKGGS